MPTSSQPEPPIIEKYRPLGHLGVGGMGRVFHGRITFPLHQARSCAIKTIRSDRFNAKGIARFTHEAMIGWDLTGHRNIITTRTFDQWPDGQLYVVLDREGPSLHDVLERLHGQFAITHLIAEHMLDALAHLQSRHIIHGDISTGNILLGRDGHAKLSDFGLSRRADARGAARASSWFADGLVGVPAYASPETLDGAPPTFASDLYSLGAVLHELVAGRPPHGSYDFTEMVIRVQLDPPGHLPGETPDALARLIRGLTEKDPAQRLSIEQAHAILEQNSGPRADRKVITEISTAWVEAARKRPGLESPSSRSDLLDAAAHHLARIRAAEQLYRSEPGAEPEAEPGAEPDADPEAEPDAEPGSRPRLRRGPILLVAAILAMLLALFLARQAGDSDQESLEALRARSAATTTAEERPTPDQEHEVTAATLLPGPGTVAADQHLEEHAGVELAHQPRADTQGPRPRSRRSKSRRPHRIQQPDAVDAYGVRVQTDWDFTTIREAERSAP